jgi:hypothetical protein
VAQQSYGQKLNKRLNTLERRLSYLEDKSFQNSWDKAEISALHLVLDVVERHEDTALAILKGVG